MIDETNAIDEVDDEGVEESYRVSLENFEGPLDLLLHLIKDKKMDIKDVNLAEITEQYLEYLADLSQIDMNIASEFVQVASVLIEIKSKNVLPKPAKEEDEPEDEESRLLRQIEEYKIFKEASEKLGVMENVNRFYKQPAKIKQEYKYNLDDVSLDGLVDVFSKLLHKITIKGKAVVPKEIAKDRFTVADKIIEIKTLVFDGQMISFFELFDTDFSKSEIINTFLAILELLKHQVVRAVQNGHFDDIRLHKGENENAKFE